MSAPQLTRAINGGLITGDQLNTYEGTCNTFNDLRSFIGAVNQQVYVRGAAAQADGGQGVFAWNPNGNQVDDNWSNIVPSGGGGQWTRVPVSLSGTVISGLSLGTNVGNIVQVVAVSGGGAALPVLSGQNLTNLPTATAPIIGSVRNAVMGINAAALSATFVADEVIVQTALGGQSVSLAGYSQTINLGVTGAGGMDVGSAPVSGYVSLYAIYGVSGTSILACNAATSNSSIYAGTHMPTGFIYSALIGSWQTNGSGQLVPGVLQDRVVAGLPVTVLSTSSTQSSYTSVSLSSAVPPNARAMQGYMTISSSVASATLTAKISASVSGISEQVVAGIGLVTARYNTALLASQTGYYIATTSSGSMTFTLVETSFTF